MPEALNPNNRERPQAREPSKCLNGRSYRERLAKEPYDGQLQDAQKQTHGAVTPAAGAVRVPAHLAPPGSPQAKQLRHLHAQLSLGQSCHRQNMACVYACRIASVVSDSLQPVDCSLPVFSVREVGFSRQDYWHIGQYGLP